ncbi:UNVERIFIED_CONTAM: hypothetical protein Scaly_1358600 [Sesamum calycinum]|uniref:ditrans,polycis-polyprenyl diphosphate synthase [(2E,6E)-farnesyldiphosphate specific] n=1 Tax=Sesamum calycinum TaxID=2727403 RepID=A0AAW2PLV9_9LAMI
MLELDFVRLVMFLRWLESALVVLSITVFTLNLTLIFIIFVFLTVEFWIWGMKCTSSMHGSAQDLDISKVKYLAVVIDSEEALQTLNVLQLLRWLAAIGLRNVCLYDKEGVLKISQEALRLWLKSERMSNETTGDPLLEPKNMSLEVISFSDGKHAVTKAANVLLKKYYLNGNTEKPNLTESDMADALGDIGHGGAEPDLMLIYGPARCHLGFPAWRIRYTEMVHMGPLKSMKFGALMKAIHRYMKRYASSGNSCKPPFKNNIYIADSKTYN